MNGPEWPAAPKPEDATWICVPLGDLLQPQAEPPKTRFTSSLARMTGPTRFDRCLDCGGHRVEGWYHSCLHGNAPRDPGAFVGLREHIRDFNVIDASTSGGKPLTYDDILAVANAARRNGSTDPN